MRRPWTTQAIKSRIFFAPQSGGMASRKACWASLYAVDGDLPVARAACLALSMTLQQRRTAGFTGRFSSKSVDGITLRADGCVDMGSPWGLVRPVGGCTVFQLCIYCAPFDRINLQRRIKNRHCEFNDLEKKVEARGLTGKTGTQGRDWDWGLLNGDIAAEYRKAKRIKTEI